MTTPHALCVSLDLNGGQVDWRVVEDYLEVTVGSESSEMTVILNLSEASVAMLASVFAQVTPALRANATLIKSRLAG